jgi:hypothetical protein
VAASVSSDQLLGGPGTRPASVDALAARTLVKGEPLSPPAGRADDFSWPRREVGREPAKEPAKGDVPVANATPGAAPAAPGAAPAPGTPGAPAAALAPQKPAPAKKPAQPSAPFGNFFGFGNQPPPRQAPPRQTTPGPPRPPVPVGRSAAVVQ